MMINFTEVQATLLRIYLDETVQWQHQPLYVALVEMAKSKNISGATVLRGILSYGGRGVWHAQHLLGLCYDLPIVIEMVDTEENIHGFLPAIHDMVKGHCLVTLERVTICRPSVD